MNPTITRIIVNALALAATGIIATAGGVEPVGKYYVNSLTGSDENTGSLDRPWKSLAKVSRREFVPGETIHFARGTSYSGCLEISCAGEPNRPIILTSYGEGSAPQFNNPRFAENCGRIIQISGSNVVLENLYLHDTPTPPPDKPPVPLQQSAQHKNVPEMGAVFINSIALAALVITAALKLDLDKLGVEQKLIWQELVGVRQLYAEDKAPGPAFDYYGGTLTLKGLPAQGGRLVTIRKY
jgi:hypothetical protein